MVQTLNSIILIFILFLTPNKTKEYVILGLGDQYVLDVYQGKLRTRMPTYNGNAIVIDKIEYFADWNKIKENYKNYQIESLLDIRDSLLYFKNNKVVFPKNVQMRNIWQAVKIKDWIICLGRTSLTDNNANLRPPFISTELITFSSKNLKAEIKYVTFQAPNDVRLWINLVEQ